MATTIYAPVSGTVVKVTKSDLETDAGHLYEIALLQDDEVLKVWATEGKLTAVVGRLPVRGDLADWILKVTAKVGTSGPRLSFSLVSLQGTDDDAAEL